MIILSFDKKDWRCKGYNSKEMVRTEKAGRTDS